MGTTSTITLTPPMHDTHPKPNRSPTCDNLSRTTFKEAEPWLAPMSPTKSSSGRTSSPLQGTASPCPTTSTSRPATAPPSPTPPVLLERTPYGKREAERAERARYFTRHGYVVVIQDCRGCFDSEGDLYFLRDEATDGYDAVEWIAAQPWCNGKVGTFGTSYAGWTQTSMAALNPPHLACQIPTMAGWNAHTSTVRQGGAFELRFMAWAFWHSATNPNKRLKSNPGAKDTLDHTDFRDWLSSLPLKEGLSPLAQIPNYERWLMDIYTKADYDDYWRQPGFGVEEYLEQYSDVPTYFVGAWYDSYTLATMDSFKALSTHKQSPVHAIMGPWTHGTYTTELSYSGDVDFGSGAALESFDDLHLRWFDRWLKENVRAAPRRVASHHLRDGRGHWPEDLIRAYGPRRKLASCPRVASAGRAPSLLVPAGRRKP